MTTKITKSQAETIMELHSNGYSSIGFLPHEQFRSGDSRDNGMRRSMRVLIDRGLIVKDGFVDCHNHPYYKLTPEAINAYQAWEEKQWKRQAAAGYVDEDW